MGVKKHIICEKQLANSMEEARGMWETAMYVQMVQMLLGPITDLKIQIEGKKDLTEGTETNESRDSRTHLVESFEMRGEEHERCILSSSSKI